MSKGILGATPIVSMLLLSACSSVPIADINTRYRDVIQQRETQYKIKSGDAITVRFYNQDPELTQTLLVLPDGRTDPFFMDDAVVAGKTIPELQAELNRFYAEQIHQSEISVQVAPAGETIIVEGEVVRASIQPFTHKMTLMQAMGNAGGYEITSCLCQVVLKRSYLDAKKPEVFRINLHDYPDLPEDLMLLPGDHIIFDRNLAILVRDWIEEYIYGFLPPFFRSVPVAALGL